MWEDKYVTKIFERRGLEGMVYTHMDAWGAVLYLKNSFGEVQRIYGNEKEYLKAIEKAPKPYEEVEK